MTAFLAELGKKLAERWVTLLVLPGLLFLAAATAAAVLRHRRALDILALRDRINDVTQAPANDRPGSIALLAAAILLASAAVALVANAVAALIMRGWTTKSSRGPARLAIAIRRSRWRRANDKVQKAIKEAARRPTSPAPEVAATIAARNRISPIAPEHPSWIGDMFRAVDLRIHETYDLDLGVTWPRLWLVAPDSARSELGAAQDAYAGSARMVGWGVLYLVLGLWWWPAAIIGVVTIGAGWFRARSATSVLIDLVESTVDLYGGSLAAQLGIPTDGRLTREIGLAITQMLQKNRDTSQAS